MLDIVKEFISKNWLLLKNIFNKQPPPHEPGTSDETNKNIVMRQEPQTQRGLKKNLIIIIIAGVAVMMVSMIVYGLAAPQKEKAKDKWQESSTDMSSNVATPATGIPGKYSDYADANQKNMTQGSSLPNQQPNQQSTDNLNGSNGQPNSRTDQNYYPPQIQDSGYRDNTYINNQQPQPAYNQAYSLPDGNSYSQDNAMGYIKSSIRIMLGGISSTNSGNENKNSSAISMTNENAPTMYTKIAPNTLIAGTIIPATLITGITSDSPGDIVAQVRQNVYDSATGQVLLIPQGSRLIGTYGSDNTGNRLKAVFTRIILPNGYSFNLDNQKATDGTGYPGLADQVDNHSSSMYRAGFLTSMFAALASSASGGQGTDNRSVGQEAISGGIANILNIGQQIMQKQINVSPTITIRPGIQFTVFLNKDLVLKQY